MNMKRIFSAIALFAAVLSADAQSLGVSASLKYGVYLMYEPVDLAVDVSNYGVSPYIVDNYGARKYNSAKIYLKHAPDGYLKQFDEDQMIFGHILVMPGESQKYTVDLSKWFQLQVEGRYTVEVVLKRGEETIGTKQIMFDIVPGIETCSISRPLPDYDHMYRKYTLVYWTRSREETLFLRVTESPDDRCVYFIELGPLQRIDMPQIWYEHNGILTVKHRAGRDYFIQTRFKSDSTGIEWLGRENHLVSNVSPITRNIIEQETAREGAVGGALRHRRRTGAPNPQQLNAEIDKQITRAGVKVRENGPVQMRK